MSGLFYSLPLSSNWLQQSGNSEGREGEVKLKQLLQTLHDDTAPLVYLGDENCGKSLLLFQAAVAYASQDHQVTYISRRCITEMPLPVHGMMHTDNNSTKLNTLTFLYMAKVEDLIQHCSRLHSQPVLPDVVIVDDLDFFLSQLTEPGPDAGCAKLCAILLDTKAFIHSKQGLGVLMLGCRGLHTSTLLKHVFRQFDFAVANITAKKSEQKQYSLVLKRQRVSVTITYSIEKIGLYLQDVSLQSEQATKT